MGHLWLSEPDVIARLSVRFRMIEMSLSKAQNRGSGWTHWSVYSLVFLNVCFTALIVRSGIMHKGVKMLSVDGEDLKL